MGRDAARWQLEARLAAVHHCAYDTPGSGGLGRVWWYRVEVRPVTWPAWLSNNSGSHNIGGHGSASGSVKKSHLLWLPTRRASSFLSPTAAHSAPGIVTLGMPEAQQHRVMPALPWRRAAWWVWHPQAASCSPRFERRALSLRPRAGKGLSVVPAADHAPSPLVHLVGITRSEVSRAGHPLWC